MPVWPKATLYHAIAPATAREWELSVGKDSSKNFALKFAAKVSLFSSIQFCAKYLQLLLLLNFAYVVKYECCWKLIWDVCNCREILG